MAGPLGPIQVIPPGLTGFLQLKQLGKNPDELLGQVAPVLELRDWYFQARREKTLGIFGNPLITANLVTGNRGVFPLLINGVANAFAVVPTNQLWYVEQFTITGATALAADFISFYPAVVQVQGVTLQEAQTVGPIYQDVVTAQIRAVSSFNNRGFWMQPGDAFAVWVVDVSSAGILLDGTVQLTRLQI